MQRNRLIALSLFILSLIAISFYGGPVSFGFFFFTVTVPLISLLYTLIMYIRFKIYQNIETKVAVVGNAVDFYFSLQNEDFYAFSGIKTEFFTDFSTISGLDTDAEYELLPHTGINLQTRLVCRYRGEYEVGVKNVIVQDHLRLFSIRFRNKETIDVKVLPRLEILQSIRAVDALSVSARESRINQDDMDVLIRDYIPGDDIRSINWKATARTGKPSVRKRTGDNAPRVSIIMDALRISSEQEEYLPLENKLLETVIALTHYYLEHGICVGFYSLNPAPVSYIMETKDVFDEFYENMSDFSFDENSSNERLFASLDVQEIMSDSLAVIMVVHETDRPVIMSGDEFDKRSIPVVIYHVADERIVNDSDTKQEGQKSDTIQAVSKRLHVVRIGYEDRLTEVL